ncbi:unnamed protein product [Linum tenue]|uniref:F-box domain-containing protein n=1 Tax=Linum tenue TaxID=586396 RepID=A0AAV0QQ88_9ROSI|nr:unnamed protein product [Linum tenue]
MTGEGATIMSRDDSRVSDLPDCILHHILSFLDTKSSVRTSILSKRWTNLWKGVNVLHLQASSFPCKSSLQNLLSSLRSHHTIVGNISFHSGERRRVNGWTLDDKLFDMVMGFADHRLEVLSLNSAGVSCSVANSIVRHHHCQSLTTLKLEVPTITPPNSLIDLGFSMLTTLELRRCTFILSTSKEVICDPFANLPSLNNLKLLGCSSRVPFRVSGDRLLKLEIRSDDPASLDHFKLGIGQVSAPKLESFYISGHAYDIRNLDVVHIPSLAQASVHLEWPNLPFGFFARNKENMKKIEMANCAFTKLLCGLHNAKSLNLCFDTLGQQSQQNFLLARMKPLIEHELSRFTRLKTFKIRYPWESPPSMCDCLKALSIS